MSQFSTPLDIVIAIDASERVTDQDISKLKEFFKASLKGYDLNSSKISVTVLSYSDSVKNVGRIEKPDSINTVLENLLKQKGKANITLVLKEINNNLFKEDLRNGKRLVLLVPVSPTEYVEDQLKHFGNEFNRKNIKVVVLRIGKTYDVKDPLDDVTGKGKNIVNIDNSGSLPDVIGKLEEVVGNALSKFFYIVV